MTVLRGTHDEIGLLPKPEVSSGSRDSQGSAARELGLWQVVTAQKVNDLQPGGRPAVAFAVVYSPTGDPAVQVVCHRANAVAALKALAGLREQLRIRVSKERLSLRLSGQELQSATHHALLQSLLRAGWSQLSDSFLLSETPAAAICDHACMSVDGVCLAMFHGCMQALQACRIAECAPITYPVSTMAQGARFCRRWRDRCAHASPWRCWPHPSCQPPSFCTSSQVLFWYCSTFLEAMHACAQAMSAVTISSRNTSLHAALRHLIHLSSVQSCMRAGTARFRPLSVRSLLPEDAELPCASIPAADLTALNAKLWSMQISCAILPDCR